MTLSKFNKVFWALAMSLMMSSVPQVACAEVAAEIERDMISTVQVVEELTRAQVEQNIQSYLDTAELKQSLVGMGISPEEASRRIASLSESELRQLNAQVDQARYAGDPYSLVVLILLIVLIIYFVKRI